MLCLNLLQKKLIFGVGLFLLILSPSWAQNLRQIQPIQPIDQGGVSISGPTSVALNSTTSYDLSSSRIIYSTIWNVSGGVITSSNNTQVTVRWTSAGSRSVSASVSTSGGFYFPSKTVTVNGNPPPPTPASPIVHSSNCGSMQLRRGSPPSGVTWYWQSSSNGTSTSNSGTYYTVISSGTVYLRARSNSTGLWSISSSSLYASVNPVPPTPQALSVTADNCSGSRTVSYLQLVDSNPLGIANIEYYWQTSAGGTSIANGNPTYRVNSSRTVYLRARDAFTGCWSSPRSLYVDVSTPPEAPPLPSLSSNSCGSRTVSKVTAPSGQTWYWQTSANGTSTSNSSTTYRVSSSRTVYLRARNNITGCWSPSRSIFVSVNSLPLPPASFTVSTNLCGNKIVKRGQPISGTTWYWQTSADGTSTSNSSSTYSVSSSRTIYLRARSNSSGCWSTHSTGFYVSVNQIPSTPSNPTISSNNCGDKTVTRGTPPSGITWFWQPHPGANRRDDASVSKIVSSSTSLFLQAYNNTTSCWSNTKTIQVTVNPKPTKPPSPAVSETCDNAVATRSTPPNGVTYYWQSQSDGSNGTNVSNSAVNFTVLEASTIYLRARNNYSGCWSSTSVPVQLGPISPQPPQPQITHNYDDEGTYLVNVQKKNGVSSPISIVDWYWQNSPDGKSTVDNSLNKRIYDNGNYFLRALGTNGCWGDAANFNIINYPSEPNLRLDGVTYNSTQFDINSQNAIQYKVFRKTPGSTSFSYLTTVDASSSNLIFTDENLIEGANYIYRVQSLNGSIASTPSDILNVYTISSQKTYFSPASYILSVDQRNSQDHYQWIRNGVAIAGETKQYYRIPDHLLGDIGSVYQCVISNSNNSLPTIYSSHLRTSIGNYYAVRDGNWNGAIWSHSPIGNPTASSPPIGAPVYISEQSVTLSSDAVTGPIYLESHDEPVELVIQSGKLEVFGEIRLDKTNNAPNPDGVIKIKSGASVNIKE